MGTNTTNYNLYKPTVAEQDWGDDVNTNFDTIDTQMKTNADDIATNTADIATKADSGANTDITSLGGLTTPLSVAQGGTGAATLADGGLVIGNAAGAVEVVAAGATTQILVGGGAATKPAWGTDIPTAVTIGSGYIYRAGGTDVPVTDGGTGKSAWTQYLIPYADSTTSLSQIAIGTDGQVLTSGGAGVAPAFEDAPSSTPSLFTSFGGSGADGAVTVSADTNFSTIDDATRAGVLQASSLTINASKILTIDTGWAFIGVTGTCTINGTITADGQGEAGGEAGTTNNLDGGAGLRADGIGSTTEGSATDKSGMAGTTGSAHPVAHAAIGTQQHPVPLCISGAGGGGGSGEAGAPVCYGGAGGGAGGWGGKGGADDNGTAAETTPAAHIRALTGGAGDNSTHSLFFDSNLLRYRGAGGGAGAYSAGGKGGGVIYIECNTLVFDGALSANGADGTDNAAGTAGGGGGGGGGIVWIRAKTISTNTGTVTVTGGTGGDGGVKDGGAGASGFKDIMDV